MASSKFPESGIAAVLDLSNWTGNVNIYVRDAGKLGRANEDVEQSARGTGREMDRAGRQVRDAAEGFSAAARNVISLNQAMDLIGRGVQAVTGLVNTLADLSDRGRAVETVTRAFDNITAGTSLTIGELSRQVQGAVSNMELMRLANTALINLEPEVTNVLAPAFGTVLNAAMAGSAATGRSLDEVLEKVITGIRRQSNMLLDDIGIWVVAEDANRRYAEANGLVASQLTETQKQAAFAEEAIRQMANVVDAAGGVTVDASQQISAGFSNMVDGVSVGVNDAMNAALGSVSGTVAEMMAQFDPYPFVEAGANIISALAQGILSGVNFVVEAVTIVAQVIADFLMGFSPPKEGPLSQIDVGGANMIDAWLGSFAKVSTGPAEELAGTVRDVLQSTMTLATGDQITVLEQMQKRVQKRLEGAVSALSKGTGSAEEVRALDEQRVALAAQLEGLRERNALEEIGVQLAETEAQTVERATMVQREASAGVSSSSREEKDKLAELQEKLRANRRQQDAYLGYGQDTTDLLREELRLRQQIADETILRGGDASGMFADINEMQAQLDRQQARGGAGGGVAAPALPGATPPPGGTRRPTVPGMTQAQATAAGIIPPEIARQFGTGGSLSFGERIAASFAPVNTQLGDLRTNFAELQGVLSGISFEGIEEFFANLQEADIGTLATQISELTLSIIDLPGDILHGLVTSILELFGVEVDAQTSQNMQVITDTIGRFITMAAVAGIVTSIGGALVGLFAAITPVGLLGLALAGLITLLEHFGPDAWNTLQQLAGLIRIAIDEAETALNKGILELRQALVERLMELDTTFEALGIDLVPDDMMINELNNIQEQLDAIDMRSDITRMINEAITGEGPLVVDPKLRLALTEEGSTVTQAGIENMAAAIRAAWNAGDEARAIELANYVIDLGQPTADQVMAADPFSFGAALQARAQQIATDNPATVDLPVIINPVVVGDVTVSEISLEHASMAGIAAHQEAAAAEGVDWSGSAAATRAGGGGATFGALPTGGGQGMGTGATMGARSAAQDVGPFIDVLRNRYVSAVATPFAEQLEDFAAGVRTTTEEIQDQVVTFFDLVTAGTEDFTTAVILATPEIGNLRTALDLVSAVTMPAYTEATAAAALQTERLVAALHEVSSYAGMTFPTIPAPPAAGSNANYDSHNVTNNGGNTVNFNGASASDYSQQLAQMQAAGVL